MLDSLVSAVRSALRVMSGRPALLTGEGDPQAAESIRRAREAQADGHVDEARTLYRYVLQRWTANTAALRALRDIDIETRDWDEAVATQQKLVALVPPGDRAAENEWLAVGYYELGRLELARGRATAAVAHFTAALRAQRDFTPAVVALGDA